jgi:hypothetical protein
MRRRAGETFSPGIRLISIGYKFDCLVGNKNGVQGVGSSNLLIPTNFHFQLFQRVKQLLGSFFFDLLNENVPDGFLGGRRVTILKGVLKRAPQAH